MYFHFVLFLPRVCSLPGTAHIILLLPLVMRSKGLSAQTIGMMMTMLSIVGLIINSISGTLADYFKAHRIVFLSALVFLTTGILSLILLPALPFTAQDSVDTHSLASLGNVTLTYSMLVDGNSSSLGVGLADMNPEMMVGEGQPLPPDLPSVKVEADSVSLGTLLQYPQFWLIFFALMAEQIGISMCVMISDAVCFLILGK